MRRLAQHCLVVAPVALAIACGGSSIIEPGAGGAGGASSSSSTSTSSSSSGSSCADFVPAGSLGSVVTIRIENDTAGDLFIGDPYQSCEAVQTYELFDGSGSPPTEPLHGSLGGCEFSCEQLQSTSCMCAADCMAPHVIRLAAGGALVTQWAGYVFEGADMPAECYSDPQCGPGCLLETEAPDEVLVRATAYGTVSCGGGSGACTCEPDDDGSCTIWDGTPTVTGTPVESSTTWNVGESTVTVAFLP